MPRPNRFGEIVAAAGRVFQEKGFDGARLEDIAQEVGIWKGSLYHYINTKEDLLFAVVSEPAQRILDESRALMEMDLHAGDKVRRLACLHVSVLASAHPFTAVYVEEIAGKHRFPEWESKDREYAAIVESIMAELLGEGDGDRPGVPSARIAARAFIGSLNWMTRWYAFDGSMEAEAVAHEIAEVFLRGVDRRGSSPAKPAKKPRTKPPAKPAKSAKSAKKPRTKAGTATDRGSGAER